MIWRGDWQVAPSASTMSWSRSAPPGDDEPPSRLGRVRGTWQKKLRLLAQPRAAGTDRVYGVNVTGRPDPPPLRGTAHRRLGDAWEAVGPLDAELRVGQQFVELPADGEPPDPPRQWRVVDVHAEPAGAVFDLIEVLDFD